MNKNATRGDSSRRVWETVVFAMLGALMLLSKIVMELFPNVHLLGVLTMVYTVAFRRRALIPIYIYVFLNGVVAGFNLWWLPYLYIWAILWGVTMLIPKRLPRRARFFVYPVVCSLHGFLFGILYAPVGVFTFGIGLDGMWAWIAAGSLFDLIHGCSNFVLGFLVLPLSELLLRLSRRYGRG